MIMKLYYLTTLLLLFSIDGLASLKSLDNDTVCLKQCYMVDDSLRSLLNHFFTRMDGTYSQYYYVFTWIKGDSLALSFIHTRDANNIIERQNGNLNTYIGNNHVFGCVAYNNLTFFIITAKHNIPKMERYFRMTGNDMVLHKEEWTDDGLTYFIYLQTESYLFDGQSVKPKTWGELQRIFRNP